MKIIRLCFKNINSLAGLHTINFDKKPLSGTGIFAITGPTGAGKSTLLDAITLALFNQTPRTGKISKTMVQDQGIILTRNTTEAFAEVDYQIKEETYRSKWAIRKTRTGSMADYEMELSILKNGEFIFVENGLKKSDIPSKNAEIIGLSFDQFVKSILLSQGEFARFLQAKPKERTELLEQITGMEIYKELGKASFAKRKEEEEKLNKLKAGTENLQPRTDQEVEELTKELNTLEVNLKETKIKGELLFKESENRKRLKHTFAEIELTTQLQQQLSVKSTLFAPQVERLKNHNNVLNFKSECLSIQELERQEKLLSSDLTEQIALQEKIKNDYKTIESDLNRNKQLLTEHIATNEAWKPKIEAVRAIDIQLDRLQETIKKSDIELEKVKNRASNCTKERDQHIEKIKKDGASLEELIKKQSIKQHFDELEEVIYTVKSAINTIKPLTQEVNSRLEQTDTWQLKEILRLGNWENAKSVLTDEAAKNDQKRGHFNNLLKSTTESNSELISQKRTLENQKDTLVKLETISAQVAEIDTELKGLAIKQTAHKKSELNYNVQLKELSEKLEIVNADLKIENAIKERIELVKKYETDRKKLVEGDECFLCGSKHHPYNLEKVDNSTENISKSDVLEKQITDLTNQIKNIETSQQEVRFFIKSTDELVKKSTTKRENLSADFDKINNLGHLKIEDITVIQERSKTVLSAIKKIDISIDTRNNLQNCDLVNEQINNLLDTINTIINLKEKAITNAQKFSAFFPVCNGLSEMYNHLLKLAENHKKEADLIRTLTSTIESDKRLSEQFDKNKKEADDALTVLEKEKVEVEKWYKNEIENRRKITSERDINNFEKTLLQTIKEAETKVNQLVNRLEKNSTEQQNSQNTVAKLKRDIDINSTRKKEQIAVITPLLNQLKLDSYIDALAQLLSSNEFSKLENEARLLKDETIKTETKIKQLSLQKDELFAKRKFVEDDDSIATMLNEIQMVQSKQQTRVGSIHQIFEEEKERKTKLGQIAKEIENQQYILDKWRKLELVIGDAKGLKFSQLAQDLTLVFMLQFTNLHLDRLSGRYQLKHNRKDALQDDLWIVDKWQGNEERSVRTLSGGESFLVSLALALGLSDLAGKKTKIESLFIDEGFGTLDQETLEIALDTLQKLQYETNRTIGIISHVPALKERIGTQIEIIKSPNGHSSIVVR